MDRERFWRVLAYCVTGITVVLAGAVWFHLEETLRFVSEHEQLFKLIGQGIGPAFAVLAFIWGLLFKAELASQAHAAGEATERARTASVEADSAKKRVEEKEKRIQELTEDLTKIAQGTKLWSLRGNAPFPEYRGWKHDPRGAKVVTVGLFKGGVGKTHLAANLAAYVSETRRQPVLLVDLDFQGSLSTQMLVSAGLDPRGSGVDALFRVDADLATVCANQVQLAQGGIGTELNRGVGLSRAWMIPADYTLAKVEGELLSERIVNGSSNLDERYRLSHVLLHPDVRLQYALIIIDTPPRMTLGTVNALIASHSVVVPAVLDRISSEAFRPFITQIEELKKDLDVDVSVAGVVAAMTRLSELDDSEAKCRDMLERTAVEILGSRQDGKAYVCPRNLPVKTVIRRSLDLGYFLGDANGPLSTQFYNPLFEDLCERVGL